MKVIYLVFHIFCIYQFVAVEAFLFRNKKGKNERRELFSNFTKEIENAQYLFEEIAIRNNNSMIFKLLSSQNNKEDYSPNIFDSNLSSYLNTPSEMICQIKNVPEFYYKSKEDKCYVLLLSGGANRGAWQTGVLRGLLGQHITKYNNTIRWDVIGGVSIGGILALAGLFHEPGEEFSYVNNLWNLWSNIRQDYLSDCTLPIWKNIFKFATHYIGGFFGSKKKLRNSICDHTPLFFYLNDTFGHQIEPFKNETYVKMKREMANNQTLKIKRREVLVSAVRYEDGEYISWNSSSTKLPDLINATLASTSVPGAFSPVLINGSHYMDGGVVMNMNIEHSIQACFKLGLAKRQEDVVIDAIETFPDTGPKVNDEDSSTESQEITFTKLLSRSFSILHSQVRGLKLLKNVLCKYPKINLRYYISPTIEEYKQFPKNAFDGNNLTGILHMLRSGLQKGWSNNFTSVNECIFDSHANPSNILGSELFSIDE
ncbi:Patatin-like phospholipase family protein [Cryptosporidium meleagridis]|uniref:Patatin-like phospholipase family protein n=1 Tax=Cryptosporidium meleagridis TaxID=93969 RepID=A0A2P4Z3X3_9CRYT|nr:Patatin-like phospholipase family protein [Cryptosporidium meleagridis]